MIFPPLLVLAAQQAGDQLPQDAGWHPAPASVTKAAYSFRCGGQRAEISFTNSYKFDGQSSGRAARLQNIGTSFYTLKREERRRVEHYVLQFALIETVKARCYLGDIFLDLQGVRKNDLDLHATQTPGPMPAPVVRTITIRKQGGVRLSHQDSSTP
jgi:hypothetical protein